MTTVLLVEQEPHLRAALTECLGQYGCAVICVSETGEAFFALEQRREVQVVVADIDTVHEDDGLPFMRMVHHRWPDLGLVITSGRIRHLRPDEVPGDGCFIPRPIPVEILLDHVRSAAHQSGSHEEDFISS